MTDRTKLRLAARFTKDMPAEVAEGTLAKVREVADDLQRNHWLRQAGVRIAAVLDEA